MRARFFVLMGVVALLAAATQGLTQYPSRGGYSGKSRGFSDPNAFFDKMANGKPVLLRAEMTDSFQVGMFDRIAERLNITNGQITREQFIAYTQQRTAERSGGAPPAPPPTAGTSGAPGAAPAPGTSAATPGSANPTAMWDQMAEASFRRHDANGDGLLNYDEMTETLRAERDKWDTNKDGFIDLNEYKAYYRARMEQRAAERGGSFGQAPSEWGLPNNGVAPPPEEEEQRPVVYRAGKLPKEIPAWFKQLDTDNDGQIGLYEWKDSGRSIEEFQEIDRNNDGFLTVEEVLRYEAQKKAFASRGGENGTSPISGGYAAAPPSAGGSNFSRPPSTGRGGQGSSGRGSSSGSGGRRGPRGGGSR